MPPADTIRAQLERILASAEFARSKRMSRFLRFTVERAIEGHGGTLKEYLLGLEVFDREPSYGPRLDPIVRVEARRLRSKLQSYYRSAGAADPVIIDISRGSYAPLFHARAREEKE